jgi:Tfp pilus assembly protein PilV
MHTSRLSAVRRQAGFTLISVLIAMLLMGIGLLAIARTMVNVTSGVTQNQNVASIATLSNSFWGVVQANPGLLTTGMVGTYTATSTAVASVPLQNWITLTTSGLPSGHVQIETFPDAGSGATCAVGVPGNSCTVKLTIQWAEVASTGIAASTRSQVFYYQF